MGLGRRDAYAPWPQPAVLVAIGLVSFVILLGLGGDLFIFSEARTYSLLPPTDFELGRFLLFPEPAWGHGRLTTMGSFEVTGGVCGVDHACVDVANAAVIAAGAVAGIVHARQITTSTAASLWVGLLWLLSPTVLALTMWQSTRFDSLAFVLAMTTLIVWWWALGQRRLSSLGAAAFVVGSVLLLALSFNAKEVTFFLPGALLILAVIRGRAVGAVRRDLLLSAVPVAYGAWFIAYALTHMAPDYAANSTVASIPRNLELLLYTGAGVHRGYMGIFHGGSDIAVIHDLVKVGLLVAVGLVVVAGLVALRRHRPRLDRATLVDWGPEVYLLAIIGFTLLVGARSNGASVYYLPLPYWAGLVLGALVLRRLARSLPRGPVVSGAAAIAFTASMALAYVGLLSEGSAWRTLQTASDRLYRLGATTSALLGDRPVEAVSWRTLERPSGWQYTLRGNGGNVVTGEIWPWLVADVAARPRVTELADGDVSTLRADPSTYDAPGEVLIVIDDAYELQLLATGGEVLYDGADPVAGV